MQDSNYQPQEVFLGKKIGKMSSPKTFEELGILVLDGSGSMKEQSKEAVKTSKADAVNIAVRDLFSRCQNSRNRKNFSFAIVNYDHNSIVRLKPTPVMEIDDQGDYNPMDGLGGATYISEGLKEAKKMAEEFLSQSQSGGLRRTVVVLIMTDGVDMTQTETVSIANALKQMSNVTVTGCFFETLGADEDKMNECREYVKGLCSDPESGFSSVSTPESLRTFFTKSMSNIAPPI